MFWGGGREIPRPRSRVRGKFKGPCLGGCKISGPIVVGGRDISGPICHEVREIPWPICREGGRFLCINVGGGMISGLIIMVGGKIPGYICLGCGLVRRTQCMCTSWGREISLPMYRGEKSQTSWNFPSHPYIWSPKSLFTPTK